jgi:hypothetical protein
MKYDVWVFFQTLSRIFKFYLNPTRITGTLHEDRYTFMIISGSFFLEWEKFRRKFVEKVKTHILLSIPFFLKLYHLWGNGERFCRAERATTIWRIRVACWITKATHPHTHTHAVCNIYCFSTATMVARTRLIISLYVHCLYCLNAKPVAVNVR